MTRYSLYLHIPFCQHRCAYCDFNTYAGIEHLMGEYVRAVCTEIETVAAGASQRLSVHTIFFGGGTPSLLPVEDLERILTKIRDHFDLWQYAEITLEANPGTVSAGYLRALSTLGFNRLSLGMQSAQPEELAFLERQHTFMEVVKAVTWSRRAGIENISLDLIFGLPEQELASWERSLKLAADLSPTHFSLYALTLEHGTPMQHWAGRGLITEPDPDAAAEMYESACSLMDTLGYQQYEISNWAKNSLLGGSYSCQHNLQYWKTLPYLGFGAGAHGFANGVRTANVLSPAVYIQKLRPENLILRLYEFPRSPAISSAQSVDLASQMSEFMFMGLRLTRAGVSGEEFTRRFGKAMEEVYGNQLERLVDQGLLERFGAERECIRLTPHGRLLGNRVFIEFV